MQIKIRPAPHDKTRYQVDLSYSTPDPRHPDRPLRLQRTAPKGKDEAGAKIWGEQNADKFIAEVFGKDKDKEDNKPEKPIIKKPALTMPEKKPIPKLSEVYLELWEAIIESLEPSTQDAWNYVWHRNIAPHWGDHPVDLIDRIAILKWRTELQKKYANGTCNDIVVKLKSIVSFAAEVGYIVGSPRITKLPTEEAAEKDPYSEEEVERLLEAARGDEFANLIMLLSLDAGLRRNELIALRWCDVNLKGEEVRIRHTMYKRKLKAVKGKKAVDIPMTPRLLAALLAAKKERRLTDHVLPGIEDPWTSESWMRNYMRAVAERAGVEWRGFHKAKHTFVSNLLDNDASLQELQLLARHKNATTTQTYMHTRKVAQTMRSGIAKLSGAQEGPEPVKSPLRAVKGRQQAATPHGGEDRSYLWNQF